MGKLLVILLATTCFGLLSCNTNSSAKILTAKAEDSQLDKKWAKSFIDSINTKFSEQISSGDSVALASHYWPDAELLLDNSDAVRGKDILNAWGALTRMGAKQMTFSTTDIAGTPTFLVETGKYEMKGAGNSLLDRGNYVVVWENRKGEWKLYRDIGCTSMPPSK